jgi:O-antigen/teichoic acid export membrane protein
VAGSSPRKRITDFLASIGIEFGTRLRGLALIPLLTAEIGVAGYGAYAQLISVSIISAQVATLGTEFTLVRRANNQTSRAQYYYFALIITLLSGGLISAGISLGASPISNLLLQSDAYAHAFLVGGGLVGIRAVARVQRNYYRSMNRIKSFNAVRGGMAYLSLAGVAVAVFLTTATLIDVVVITIGSELLGLLFVQAAISSKTQPTVPSIDAAGG